MEKKIDAHVHFWKLTENDWYPELPDFARAAGKPEIATDHLVSDYRSVDSRNLVTGFVHVSATTSPRAYLCEGAWVERLAEDEGIDLRIVGSLDPDLTEKEMVEDLEQQANSPLFSGIRFFPGIDPNAEFLPTVFRWLEERNFVFDLVSVPGDLARWIRTLADFPRLRVVLEHAGSPASRDDSYRKSWARSLTKFANETRASCKLTGLGMAFGTLAPNEIEPWASDIIEIFGWNRVLYGSNMPIELMAGSLHDWNSTLSSILSSAKSDEIERFQYLNAREVYWSDSTN